MIDKPIVLSIAGFDPCGGAGIMADIKTFEAFNVYGVAVCTANTCQNDIEFTSANWIPINQIALQYRTLQKRFRFDYVKIGIVKDFYELNIIIDLLLHDNEQIKIIWDPVLHASAGYRFHSTVNLHEIEEICKKSYLITPNLEELSIMFPHFSPTEAGSNLSKFVNVLVKGGHSLDEEAIDVLYTSGEVHTFEGKKLLDFSKHGTGCVLSAAIAASLAKGEDLVNACKTAKKYTAEFIASNHGLVGFHNYMQ